MAINTREGHLRTLQAEALELVLDGTILTG